MRKILLPLFNTVTFIATLIVNYLSTTGKFGSNTANVSDKYHTLITPSGYAFSIWGLIYGLLLTFLIYQWSHIRHDPHAIIKRTGGWFAFSNILNSLWLFLWGQELLGYSVACMMVLLFTLIVLALRLNLEIWDAPFKVIAMVWWPFTLYLGWIIVASVTNVAAWLTGIGWSHPFSEATWAVIMILVSTGVYLFLIYTRNMREAALVGVWGLVAIAVGQWQEAQLIKYAAFTSAAVLLINASSHAYKNRKTNPIHQKLKSLF